MSKRLEGRGEPILDPDLPIVDAHHHLFDKAGTRYLLDEFLDDARAGHRVVASVYVEASAFRRQDGPEILRPLGEVEFANGMGAMCDSGDYGSIRACAAIVGHADLRIGDKIGWLLDRYMAAAPDRFRGIRQITMEHPSDAPFRYFFTGRPPEGVFQDPNFRAGFRELARRNMTYDATGFHLQLPDIGDLADAFPDTTLILNHMTVAMGLEMDAAARNDLFKVWRKSLLEIAQRPNMICKIGGLGMPYWGFGLHERKDVIGYLQLAEIWRPFVETAIESFGPDRCMMESNFPADARSCGYVPLWNALKHITSGMSGDERRALFAGTAARVYRIDLPI